MAKKSDKDIKNMSVDWACDPTSGNIPFSGASVQRFIKQSLNSKVGAGLFDNNDGNLTIYLFKDQNDKQEFEADRSKVGLIMESIPLRFETTQYRIRITPDGSTTVNISVNARTLNLAMALQAEKRDLGEAVWQPTNQDIGVRVYLDARNTGNYEEIPELAQTVLASDGTLSVDVRSYLPVGTSRIRLYFYAVDDPTLSSSIVWTITLAEMYIEEWSNTWYSPLIENINDGYYHLGGFKIVGTVTKILHIEISTALAVVAYYERDLGPSESIETPYMFTRNEGLDLANPKDKYGDSLSALETGIYSVKVWLTSGELSTEDTAIVYNIMYIATGDEYSAKLAIMNYSGNEVNNYDESAHLCDYAVYNAGQSYGTPTITITPYIESTAETPTVITSQIETKKAYELHHSINLITSRENLKIHYRVAMTDNYQEGVSRINNAEIFPSVEGATFYLNTSLRSNGETATRETVYNTANNSTTALASVTWTGMSWVDGMDGWYQDDTGRKCLFLPARTRLSIPTSSYSFFPGDNITIELCYKVVNVSDYNENVITIGDNPTAANFFGLRIKPTNIAVHATADTTAANDAYQGTNVCDEEVIHLLLSIQKRYGEVSDEFNLVTGYVNGVRNFQYSYPSTGTGWASNTATAIFGSDTADLYLYMVRAYTKPVSSSGAEGNWLNSLVTLDEKTQYRHFIDSILSSSGSRQVSYEKIKDEGKYNFFVVEMTSGNPNVPQTLYPNGGRSNIEMHYGKDENGNSRSSWDWKIYDVETKGQGTTSMNYWLWNIRWRIDKTDSSKKRDVAYYDTPVISGGIREFVELPKSSSKTVWFDGDSNHPAVKRITAKINFASSMQSHKMGATRAYNMLHDALLDGAMKNEAQQYAESHNKPAPTVAIYQYPAYGFQRNPDGSHTFIGLFTIGPDKGDKPTFGYDLVTESNLVTLEGVDHHPQATLFGVPWDEQLAYYVDSGGDGFLASKAPASSGEGYQKAVEVSNAGTADTGSAVEAMPVLESKFKPAYDVIYDNSTLIVPVALNDATFGGVSATAESVLQAINANTDSFRGRTLYSRVPYTNVQFWIEGEYKLYHYDYETSSYVSGYKSDGTYTALDIRTDTGIDDSELTGLTLEQQNDLFKGARRARFLADAPTYWDMNELAFNYVFLVIFGATDNFAKNQYPYYMGGKWKFRQDDLDTIEDIDNNGGQTKPFDIEFIDTVDGSPYFAGSDSVLWNLVHEAMWSNGSSYTGISSMGRQMIEKMSELSGGDDTYDGFIKFFERYFWKNAQDYFTQSAYNIDAQTKYEAAWLTGRSFSADPLRQSLGNHYSAERLWVKNRAVYCMSLFGAGVFGDYTQSSLGRIQFRPDMSGGSMTLTPANKMYPCLIVGDNDIRPTSRTSAGSGCTFTSLSGNGQTQFTIQAVNYLTSLGDLKDLKLGTQDGGTLSVSGKKLRSIKLGDSTQTVTTNVSTLSIDAVNGLPCLEVVDLRNATSMSGTLDLTKCKRVKEVYAEGTNIGAVSLPRGSKIVKLHLSDNVTTLSYQVIKSLSDLVLPSDPSSITQVFLEECDALDGMSTIEEIYNTTGQTLQYIRLLWGTEKHATGPQIRMLARMKQNLDKTGASHTYNGIDNTGSPRGDMAPVLEGKLLATAFYQSDIDILAGSSEPTDSTDHPGMKVIQASYFGPLYITYALDNEYIVFADPDVIDALYAVEIGDGIGVTLAEASEVTSIGSAFTGKTNISSFDEFANFTSVTSLADGTSSSGGAFRGCTSLESVTIPDSVSSIGAYAFSGCTSLTTLTLLKNSTGAVSVGSSAFANTAISRINIQSVENWMRFNWSSDLTTGHSLYISNSELTSLSLPNSFTTVKSYAFYNCIGITSLTVPSGYTSIGERAFSGCTSLTGAVSLPASVSSIGSNAFYGCSSLTSFSNAEAASFGNGALAACPNLKDVTIRASNNFNLGILSGSCTSQRDRGNLIIYGNVSVGSNSEAYHNWLVVTGVLTTSFGNYRYADALSIGTVNFAGGGNGIMYPGFMSLKFFEVLGDVTCTDNIGYEGLSYGAICHLGKNGVITALPSVMMFGDAETIYVGPGESADGDQAVLELYLADTNWQPYANRLARWCDYNGIYKNNPAY